MERQPLLFNGKDTGEDLDNGNYQQKFMICMLEIHGKPLYEKLTEKGITFGNTLKEFFEKEFEINPKNNNQ